MFDGDGTSCPEGLPCFERDKTLAKFKELLFVTPDKNIFETLWTSKLKQCSVPNEVKVRVPVEALVVVVHLKHAWLRLCAKGERFFQKRICAKIYMKHTNTHTNANACRSQLYVAEVQMRTQIRNHRCVSRSRDSRLAKFLLLYRDLRAQMIIMS